MYYILIKKSDRDVKSLYQYYTEPEQIEITDEEGNVTGYEQGTEKVWATDDTDALSAKVDDLLNTYDLSSIDVIRKMRIDYVIGITEESTVVIDKPIEIEGSTT